MTNSTTRVEESLRELDTRIDLLASNGDFAALAEILAPDFIYSHSTGQSQDKDEWLASLHPLAGRRLRVASDVRVELHGEIAVTNGDLDIVWTDAPTKYNRYVRVFRRQDGRWQAISQRTVPAPDREPAAG